MDNITLKKKLSSYVSQGGYLKNVSDELLYEILIAWENWTASGSEFYKSLGKSYVCTIDDLNSDLAFSKQ